MLSVWILAARPRTLPAAVAPVLLGTALALGDGVLAAWPAALCFAFALLVQIGANFANDYYDGVKGTDTAERLGPTRAVAAGLVRPPAMWRATLLVLVLAFAVGCLLLPYGGLWLLVVGVASIVCALAYTGGPYPLGYHGWGDVFVFVFFGLVATVVTYAVQAGGVSPAAWAVAVVPGALAVNILVVNNLRDRETDAVAGKRTLAVRLGRGFALAQYRVMLSVALVVPLLLAANGRHWLVLLPWLLVGWGWILNFRLQRAQSKGQWERALAGTAKYLLAFCLLLVPGLVLG